MSLQVTYSLKMVPRHLPKKLLCVALIGTSILAVIYYTNGISKPPDGKFKHSNQAKDYKVKQNQNHLNSDVHDDHLRPNKGTL